MRSRERGGWLVVFALVCGAAGVPARALAQDAQKRVLVLYSTRRDTRLAILGDRDMPRILDQGLPRNADYYSEYLDAPRFPDPQYEEAFRSYLALKYGSFKFDVVVAMQDMALEFVTRHRDDLFAGMPVVFQATSRPPAHLPNSAGLLNERDFGSTISLAMQLQPEIEQVFVVAGKSGRDKTWEGVARQQFSTFEPRLKFTYLSGLSTAELQQRVSSLPERSVIFYLLVYQDGEGENVNPIDYIDRLSPVANRPIYSWVDSALDHGVVGGSMLNLDMQVRGLADLALRVLRGERADDIPTTASNMYTPQVDWRQVQRWGIGESRLPAATQVLFRVEEPWRQYGLYILGAIALMTAEAALIVGLAVQRSRRRRAENETLAQKAELAVSYERIRDLGRRLLSAQELERSRIARELHDDVGQRVALVQMDLQLLSQTVTARGGEGKPLQKTLSHVEGIATSVHNLSHRLHPATLGLMGLGSALRQLQKDFSTGDCVVVFTEAGPPRVAPPTGVTIALFRVAQEAVQNAVKHSGAREVRVHLDSSPEQLTLRVIDDGVGFDFDGRFGKGLGLISMQERLDAVGATLLIHSKPGSGTRVEITVPAAALRTDGALAVS